MLRKTCTDLRVHFYFLGLTSPLLEVSITLVQALTVKMKTKFYFPQKNVCLLSVFNAGFAWFRIFKNNIFLYFPFIFISAFYKYFWLLSNLFYFCWEVSHQSYFYPLKDTCIFPLGVFMILCFFFFQSLIKMCHGRVLFYCRLCLFLHLCCLEFFEILEYLVCYRSHL